MARQRGDRSASAHRGREPGVPGEVRRPLALRGDPGLTPSARRRPSAALGPPRRRMPWACGAAHPVSASGQILALASSALRCAEKHRNRRPFVPHPKEL